MASDTNMNVTEVKCLKEEIAQELSQVEGLLAKVAAACETQPGEDDDIFTGLQDAGRILDENWKTLCGTFRKAEDILSNIIEGISERISQTVENVKNMRKDL